jgi:hypothetical protein
MKVVNVAALLFFYGLARGFAAVATTGGLPAAKAADKIKEFAVAGYLPEWRYGGANFDR